MDNYDIDTSFDTDTNNNDLSLHFEDPHEEPSFSSDGCKIFDKVNFIKIYRSDINDNFLNQFSTRSFQTVTLHYCPFITKKGLDMLLSINNTKYLAIDSCTQLELEDIYLSIEKLKNLILLHIGDFGVNIMQKICNSIAVSENNICDLRLDNINDMCMQHIAQCVHLVTLNIDKSPQITFKGYEYLKQMKLHDLVITESNISSRIFYYMSHIRDLCFDNITIYDNDLKYIQNCKFFALENAIFMSIDCLRHLDKVPVIDFSFCNNLTDKHLKYMNTLNVRNKITFADCCYITSRGLVFIGKWKKIRTVGCCNIGDINFQGTPTEVSDNVMQHYIKSYM